MFDVGFFELLTVAIVALLALGPERLPHAARMVGAAMGKLRRTFIHLKADIEREIEFEDLKKRLETLQIEKHPEQPIAQIQEAMDASASTDQPPDEDNDQTSNR